MELRSQICGSGALVWRCHSGIYVWCIAVTRHAVILLLDSHSIHLHYADVKNCYS